MGWSRPWQPTQEEWEAVVSDEPEPDLYMIGFRDGYMSCEVATQEQFRRILGLIPRSMLDGHGMEDE
jgi:hypothetical protein